MKINTLLGRYTPKHDCTKVGQKTGLFFGSL